MFSSRNKKNIATFWLKKVPYQELWEERGKGRGGDVKRYVTLLILQCEF